MFTRVRPGNALRGEHGLPVPPPPDLASAAEAALQAELARHVARAAELDVIAEVLAHERGTAGVERVEEVRRRETRRFFAALRAHRQARWRQWLAS